MKKDARDEVYERLKEKIFCRSIGSDTMSIIFILRYNQVSWITQELSQKILFLPIYPELDKVLIFIILTILNEKVKTTAQYEKYDYSIVIPVQNERTLMIYIKKLKTIIFQTLI